MQAGSPIGLSEVSTMSADRQDNQAPMRIGAASNFSQGWNPRVFQSALALPLTNWRDSIRWADVETVKGRYTFESAMTLYPERLAEHSARLTLTLNWGNPLYDSGYTPYSPEGLAAFGRFVAEVLRRYPAVDTLEIGNEINASAFVTGPMKEADPAMRIRYHLAMVRSAAAAVRSAKPSVKVIGGSTHSLPAGFLWPLLDEPEAADLRGLSLHPYTTPIDQLRAQIGVLRRHPATVSIPLYITEFGSLHERIAADDLVRAYATLSSLGADELDWYPLSERGDGFVPLLLRDGSRTDAGRAFQFVTQLLSGFRGQDMSPDPFTVLHAFGPETWVLWGAPRQVMIDRRTVSAFSATGAPLDDVRLGLSEDRALILKGKAPLQLGGNVTLGCTPLIADSYYGFTYPAAVGRTDSPAGFLAYAGATNRGNALEILPGQQANGVPWTPYLGRRNSIIPRVTADLLLPGPDPMRNAIFLKYVARADADLKVQADFNLEGATEDGIGVSFSIDGRVLVAKRTRTSLAIEREERVRSGQALVFVIDAGGTVRGDTTKYRIRIYDKATCPTTAMIDPKSRHSAGL